MSNFNLGKLRYSISDSRGYSVPGDTLFRNAGGSKSQKLIQLSLGSESSSSVDYGSVARTPAVQTKACRTIDVAVSPLESANDRTKRRIWGWKGSVSSGSRAVRGLKSGGHKGSEHLRPIQKIIKWMQCFQEQHTLVKDSMCPTAGPNIPQ